MVRFTLLTALSAALFVFTAENASARGRCGGCCCGGCYVAVPCPPPPPPCGPQVMPGPHKKKMAVGQLAAPAMVVVSLPADARLLIDDQPTTSTSGTRVFQTPALQPGSEYVYTLKAEVTRDGQVVPIVKEVTVRAGEESRVSLAEPVQTAAR